MLPKSNQSPVAALTPNKSCNRACCTQIFLCQSPAQVQWVPPSTAQGKDTQSSPTATPTCSSWTCKNKNTGQAFRQTQRSIRFIVGLFLRSTGVTELMGVCQTTLSETPDSAPCYKYLDFLYSLQAAMLTLHFSLCAD